MARRAPTPGSLLSVPQANFFKKFSRISNYFIISNRTRTLDRKIQIQISTPATCSILTNSRKRCKTKQKTRGKLHNKVFGRIKESKCGISCKYMCIQHTKFTSAVGNCRRFCRGKQCFYSNHLGKNIAKVIIS